MAGYLTGALYELHHHMPLQTKYLYMQSVYMPFPISVGTLTTSKLIPDLGL